MEPDIVTLRLSDGTVLKMLALVFAKWGVPYLAGGTEVMHRGGAGGVERTGAEARAVPVKDGVVCS